MPKPASAFRAALFVVASFSVGGALASGCGLDDTVVGAGITAADGGGADATFDGSPGDSGGEAGTGACASNPCENGGTCTDEGDGGFSCACAAGFSGATCGTNIDECLTTDGGSPCLNGGTCTDGVATYSCSCPVGFTGTNCETNVDDCSSNPCVHGTCTDGVNTYSCACNTGFAGGNCDTCATNYFSYPTCTFCTAGDTCSSHGTCSSTGTCQCNSGFATANCGACATDYYNFPTCTFCQAATTCTGHGTCSSTGACVCNVTGYSGANCSNFSGSYSGSAAMPSTGGVADTKALYGQVNGTAAFSLVSTDNQLTIAVASTLTKLTFGPSSGDIGSRHWTGTIMKNGVATGLTCTIAPNGTTCNVTMNVSLAVNDKINIEVQQDQSTNTDRTAAWTINYTQP